MADSGSFNADLGINMQFNIDSAGLVEMTRTIKEISKGKDLQRYWKDIETATDNAAKAIERYNKNTRSKELAENFLKQINALKAITSKENLSDIFPSMDINFDELVGSAKKLAPKINAEFSSSNFSQAFKTFDLLKDKGIELGEVFSKLADYSSKVDENFKLRIENSELKDLFGEQDIGKLKKDLSEIQKLRNEAEETFDSFLNINKIEKVDRWGDEKFSEYFYSIRNGSLTATEAIARFKTEYAHLLEDSYRSNGDSFGLDQLQAFSEKLDSIFRQVEETSKKINDIISNGVITKSVQNLSEDMSLSSDQRSIFNNILQDEESLKSITALIQKLIKESNQAKNTEVFNTEQFNEIKSLFINIESSLDSIKCVLVDVGDGEELSPLLKQLDNIREAASNIKLSLNLDLGNEVSERLNQKVSQATQRQLEAYRKLFSAMKGTGKTNKEMLKFFEPDDASATELIGMYQGIIKRAEEQFKIGNSNIYKKYLGSTYDDLKKEIKNANTQLGRAENKRSENGILGDLFGNSKDLSGVIEQLGTIISKLNEISKSAKEFAETFKNGLNVNASVDEIEKLTNRVKEFEDEIAKIKNPTAHNASAGTKSESEEMKQVGKAAKEAQKQVSKIEFSPNTDGFDDVISKFKILKEEASQISKITKESNQNKDGGYDVSYKATKKDGTSYYLGENSNPNVLKASEVVYNSAVEEKEKLKENKKAWKDLLSAVKQYKKLSTEIAKRTSLPGDETTLKELKEKTIPALQKNVFISPEQLSKSESLLKEIDAETSRIAEKKMHLDWDAAIKENEKFDKNVSEINGKVAETGELLSNLSIPKELNNEWTKIINDVDALTKKLKNGDLSPSDYSSQRDALLKDYNNKVEIQRRRDVEMYNSASSENSAKDNERQVKVQKALNDALNRYETLQKRIANGNGLSTDEAEAKSLLDTIHELQREDVLSPEKLTESNQRINRLNQSVEDIKRNIAETTLDNTQDKIDKYRTTLKNKSAKPVFEDQSVDYKKMLAEFASAISTLEDYKTSLAGISELTDEQKNHLQELTDKCQSAAKAFTLLDAAQKGSTEDSRWKEIDKLSKYLTDNTKLSKEAKRELNDYLAQLKSGDPSVNVKKIHTAWTKVAEQERAAGREGKSFFTMLSSAKLGHLVSQIAGFFSFYDLINVGKQAFEFVKQLDYALVDLKKTTSMSSTELERFYYDSNDVAKKMGVTTQEIIDQASAWSRLGYSTKEAATEMAQLSSQFSSISPGMDTDTAQEGLVSIMKAWDIDPDQVKSEIMDNINALGNAMAESNQDIVEGMERSAAALAAVGTDYEDAFAMFSGMQEVLQSAEVAGRALRSISMRIRGYDETTEELSDDLKTVTGDLADLTKTAQHAQGVSIFKDGSTTEFKSLVDYFGEINEIWDEMSQKQQNDFLQKAFGKTQAQAGSALIQNYSAVTKALEVMDEAAGSSDREMETVKESLEYKINALKETWVGTAQDILDRGDLGKIIDALTTVSEAIGSVTSNIGLLKTAALGISAALSFKNVGRDKTYSLFCHFEYADNTHNLLRIRRFRVCYS